MKNNKRAFTIVELVIVIAVIGILAAVLIPTFSSLIEKANQNADESAVTNMNKYLAADEQINGKPGSWVEAVKVLSKSNLDAQNYKSLSDKHYIVYDYSINRVLYVEEETKAVVFPEEYKDLSTIEGYVYGSWQTLEGQMVADDSWLYQEHNFVANNKVQVSDGKLEYKGDKESADKEEGYIEYFKGNVNASYAVLEFKSNPAKTGVLTFTDNGEKYVVAKVNDAQQLTSYVDYVQKSENENGENFTLLLTEDIEFTEGAQWKPFLIYGGSIDSGNVNENNEVEPVEIKNFTMSDRSQEVVQYDASTDGGSYYFYGFISVFEGDYLGNLKFENVNVVDPGLDVNTYGYGKTGHTTATVIGAVNNYKNADVVLENIRVESGTVTGLSRVGGLFGIIGGIKDGNGGMTGGSVTIKDCYNGAAVTSRQGVNQAHSTAGGLVAATYMMSNPTAFVFDNCVNAGNVTGYFAGGFLGGFVSGNGASATKFVECTNSGTITAKQSNVHWDGSKQVSGSFVDRPCVAGSFWGNNEGSGMQIIDSVSTGKVVLINALTKADDLTNTFELANGVAYAFGVGQPEGGEFTGTFEFDVTNFAKLTVCPQSGTDLETLKGMITAKGAFFANKTLQLEKENTYVYVAE